jgi:hypothetical protein
MKKQSVGLLSISVLALASASVARAEDARVLPKGRSRLSVIVGDTANVTQTFNNDGNAESLTAPYNISLNSVNLRKFAPEMDTLVQLLNDTKLHYDEALCGTASRCLSDDPSKPLLGDALARGFLNVDAEANVTRYNFAYQYGLTDRLTIGVGVPYVHNQVHVDNSLTGANTASTIQSALGGMYPGEINDGLTKLRTLNVETFQNMLVERGYNRFGDYDGTSIGDIVFGGRYNYLSKKAVSGAELINSAQAGISIPTGRLKDPADITAIDYGSGAWELCLAHLVNYSPRPWIMFSNGTHYTARFKSSRQMRVRNGPSDFAPDASAQEEVDVRLGDKFWTNLDTQFNLTKAVSLNANYEWFWWKKSQYQGSRNKDYGYLSELTDGYCGTLGTGVSISTIPAFLDKSFLLPLSASFNYYWPLAGRNAVIANYWTAELALYF